MCVLWCVIEFIVLCTLANAYCFFHWIVTSFSFSSLYTPTRYTLLLICVLISSCTDTCLLVNMLVFRDMLEMYIWSNKEASPSYMYKLELQYWSQPRCNNNQCTRYQCDVDPCAWTLQWTAYEFVVTSVEQRILSNVQRSWVNPCPRTLPCTQLSEQADVGEYRMHERDVVICRCFVWNLKRVHVIPVAQTARSKNRITTFGKL